MSIFQVQFLMVFLHNAQLLFIDCDYPKISVVFIFPNALFFMYLFNDFYVKAYKRKISKARLEIPESGEEFLHKTNKNGLVKSKKEIGNPSPNVNKKFPDSVEEEEGKILNGSVSSSDATKKLD